jgi:hypothetical protein
MALEENMQLLLSQLEEALEERRCEIVEREPWMEHRDVTIGFTKNSRSTTTDFIVRGDFHLIANREDKAIVVYALAKDVHFGILYNEEDYVIQPIGIDELKKILTSAPTYREQFNHARRAIEELDKLIGKFD